MFMVTRTTLAPRRSFTSRRPALRVLARCTQSLGTDAGGALACLFAYEIEVQPSGLARRRCGIAGAHQDFSVQSNKADQAMDKLEYGKVIGWSEIGAALEVPSNP